MVILVISAMGAFARPEQRLVRERQAEGMAFAKARGVYKRRPRSLAPDVVAAPPSTGGGR
jgi:DNA invertase Pin-like site-specific DNA recombinase